MRKHLNRLLQLSGFEIRKGTLEVFPQPGVDSNGQGLRLPLQEGFAWLDQKTLEVENERFEYSPASALELFIDALNGCPYYGTGLTGPSQRADAIFCLRHYLFYGDPESMLPALGYGLEQDRKKVIETILSESHHSNSKELNRDRADAIKQVERAHAWVPPPGEMVKIQKALSRCQPLGSGTTQI